MSESKLNYKSFSDFYRINFIGRPTELRKLIEDKYTFIVSKKDANSIIKAHRIYYGWQYLGNIFAFMNYLAYIKLTKKLNISKKINFLLITVGISPLFIFFIYSHFSYWEIIRPIVKNSREISYKLRDDVKEIELTGTAENFNKEEFQIFFNRNIDYHNYIAKNITFGSCIMEIFGLNKALRND